MTRSIFLPAIIVLTAALAGCSGDGNIVRDVAVASGVTGGEPKPAPDFVSRTRTPAADYMPVGVEPARPRLRPKSATDVKAAESQLAETRSRNETRGREARRAGAAAPAAAPVVLPVEPPPGAPE